MASVRENRAMSTITPEILVIFDFDETLVHEDGRTEDFNLLLRMKTPRIEFCLATRNHCYNIQDKMVLLEIPKVFTFIEADYRPKNYQVGDILFQYKLMNIKFKKVYFIDDHQPNIELVQHSHPSVHCLTYGVDIQDLNDFFKTIGIS